LRVKALVLGGVRSGKSRHAGELAAGCASAVTLIATGAALDAEMAARIEAHRRSRPPHWRVVEEPLHLAAALCAAAAPGQVIIVDCLTLWLTNLLCQEDPNLLRHEVRELLHTLPRLPGHWVLVANEVGLGIMPVNALARRFADEAGTLHQQLAVLCDGVTFMAAGLPLTLKPRAGDAP
jgi:adenosylcobinamide kinase/adenosylcobinamide-phosphate guanylyltransferase